MKLLKFQRGLSSEAAIERCDELASAFRDYKVAVIPIVTDDLEMVTRTFQRVNSQGSVMGEMHMVHALTWSKAFSLLDGLDEYKQKHLAPVGWLDVDDDRVLAVCKVRLDLDIYKTEPDQLSRALRERPALLEEAVKALAAAAQFLRATCGLPSPQLLPYGVQAVILADACAEQPEMSPAATAAVADWFWITSFSELFFAMSGTRLQTTISMMRLMVEDGRRRWPGVRAPSRRALAGRFDFRFARAKTLSLRLAALGPLGPELQRVETDDLFAVEGPAAMNRLVPRSAVRARLFSGPENRLLGWPKDFSALQSRLLDAAAPQQLLDSHCVPRRAAELLWQNKMEAFLEARHAALESLEDEFFQPVAARFAADADGGVIS